MKRKVLIIVENESLPPDPRVLNEARSLHANGYEVTVLSPQRKGYRQWHQDLDGIHIYRHPMPSEGRSAAGYVWEYGCALFWECLFTWWIFLRHGFHVIQGCNPPDTIFLAALPFKLLGVMYIFDHHDACPELYLSKYQRTDGLYKLLLWLEKMTYRFSDAVIVTNNSYRDLATSRGRVSPDDVFVVRNGPDPHTLKAEPSKAALKNGKPYMVGYVGCMNVQDGLDILIEVAEYLRSLGRSEIRFVCVGRGPELRALRKTVEERDLLDTVTFTGFLPDEDLLAILSTADVCVNPDRPSEMNSISTMIKIMEYMALGKPIVQFESKEGRFSAQEASLYADPTEPVKDFANKILWLLERPEERRRMGAIGRRRVEKELAWEYSVEHLLAAYERAFSKRGASGDIAQNRTRKKAACSCDRATGDDASATRATVNDDELDQRASHLPYVLITPARNEEAFIKKTIESVISQTHKPLKWVIVDDGSTDGTPDIVARYSIPYPWITLLQMPKRRDRNFAGKVHAFNVGLECVQGMPVELIGNLDADISFGRDHFAFLTARFVEDPLLGIAGTAYTQEGWDSMEDSFEGEASVHGACQLFRRECFLAIGGYCVSPAGGVDWIAVTTARMKGWKTRNYPQRRFRHHRTMGTAERSQVGALFDYGKKDYFLGGSVIWELFRAGYRMTKRPVLLGGVALLAGYCWAAAMRLRRPVSQDLVRFHRGEQMKRLNSILFSLIRLKKPEKYYLPKEIDAL
jgi:glycosyltransferase involved in cell wall biosynthesis